MLVLTRKQGERIQIGDDVTITVVRTKGKAVRLGIQAPSHVAVLRGEIAKSIAVETGECTIEEAEAGETQVEQLKATRGLGAVGVRGPLHELVGARGM